MRSYETIYIMNPELSEEEVQEVTDKFVGILAEGGAQVVKLDAWGRRRMAYAVKKHHKGYYLLMEYGAEPAAVSELERNFKIDERVIRYLTINLSQSFQPPAPAEEEAPPEALPEQTEAEQASAQENQAQGASEQKEEAPAPENGEENETEEQQ